MTASKISEIKNKVKEWKSMRADYVGSLEECLAHIEQQDRQIKILQFDLHKTEKDKEIKRELNRSLIDEREALKTELTEWQQLADEYSKKCDSMTFDVDMLRSKCEELQKNLDEEKRNRGLEFGKHIFDLNQEIKTLKERLEQVRKERDFYQAQCEDCPKMNMCKSRPEVICHKNACAVRFCEYKHKECKHYTEDDGWCDKNSIYPTSENAGRKCEHFEPKQTDKGIKSCISCGKSTEYGKPLEHYPDCEGNKQKRHEDCKHFVSHFGTCKQNLYTPPEIVDCKYFEPKPEPKTIDRVVCHTNCGYRIDDFCSMTVVTVDDGKCVYFSDMQKTLEPSCEDCKLYVPEIDNCCLLLNKQNAKRCRHFERTEKYRNRVKETFCSD